MVGFPGGAITSHGATTPIPLRDSSFARSSVVSSMRLRQHHVEKARLIRLHARANVPLLPRLERMLCACSVREDCLSTRAQTQLVPGVQPKGWCDVKVGLLSS